MNSNISMVAATNRQLNNFFQTLPQWNIEAMTGYTPRIRRCPRRNGETGFRRKGKNYHQSLTHALLGGSRSSRFIGRTLRVLNHKIWQHNENNAVLAELYNSLWEQADGYATTYLEGEELSYFYRITD